MKNIRSIILWASIGLILTTLLFSRCTNRIDLPESIDIVEVGLSFDKYYPDYTVSPMGRTSAVPFTHNISGGMATVTVASIDLNGNGSNIILHKELNLLHEIILTLNVGWNYTIYVDPDIGTDPTTGVLVFSGMSDGFIASANMNSVLINCSTNQSLVIIENANIHDTVKPSVEFYSDNTFTVLENTYGLGLTGDWYSMYVVDLSKGYRYIIRKSDGTTVNVKLFNLIGGEKYAINVHLIPPEEGSGSLDIDIDGAFTTTTVDV
jgi:hypothetical protein